MERILITGGTGCIGAVTVHQLFKNYSGQIEQIVIASRSSSTQRLEMWLGDDLQNRIDSQQLVFAAVDLGNTPAIKQLLKEFQPTRVIHLGALQSPDCDARPEMGVAVNVTGTLNLFDCLAEQDPPLKRFVFASSGAVYGKRSMYPADTVDEDSQLAPPNLYGVWKVAGEHLAALFHQRTGVPIVSLRLNTTYGPGRDQGTTSAPTRVIRSLVEGAQSDKTIPCLMPYQGRENYHYVEDVGAHFAGVCMLPFDGCQAFNIRGQTIEVQQFLNAIGVVAEELELSEFLETGIADEASPNLFICDLDDRAIQSHFPEMPCADIRDGIRNTIQMFQTQALSGKP